jgi:DNA-binding MarR family transcriptional regulator
LTSQASSTALDAWARLLRGHASTTRSLSAELLADHGLTINDYEALLLLSRAEDNHMKRVDLAERLLLTPSGVTRLLDGLEKVGCVEKASCDTDARITYAVLTDDGRRKLEEASASHLAAVEALFEERFSGEELATLADLLGRLPGADAASGAECEP